jgi:hypothetical protein
MKSGGAADLAARIIALTTVLPRILSSRTVHASSTILEHVNVGKRAPYQPIDPLKLSTLE